MIKKIKKVDINEYMSILIDLINQGKTVPLLITGNSMMPFLAHQRDTIYISKAVKPFKKGDIVFYIRKNKQYVVHRIHHIDKYGHLFIIGDAQTVIEGPVEQTQVFGIVNSVNRKNKIVTNRSFIWKFFSIVWIRTIILRLIFIKIHNFKNRFR